MTYGYIAFCRCERDIMSYNLQYLTYWLRFVPTVYVIVVGEVELCLLSAVHMYRLGLLRSSDFSNRLIVSKRSD